MNRRELLLAFGAAAITSKTARAMQMPQGTDGASRVQGASNVPMDESRYKPVRRAARPATVPRMSTEDRDAVEHRIHCQCGCGLDVYTCRTTDFSCPVSPAMHADADALAKGGYTADEILAAFAETYGERALMAPPARGFNVLGWTMPFVVLAVGTAVATVVLRRRMRGGDAAAPVSDVIAGVEAADLERVNAAVRADDR